MSEPQSPAPADASEGPARSRQPLVLLAALVVVAVVGFVAAYVLAGGDEAGDPAPIADEATADDAAAGADDEAAGGDDEAPARELDITVEPNPDPPKIEGTTFVVAVAEDGEPVAGAEVRVSLDMTEHSHSGVSDDAEETEPGRYEARLTFPMRGKWSGSARVQAGDAPEVTETISYVVQ